MAASEKTLVHREDAFPNLIPHQDLRPMAAHEESNYVDLELHGKLKRTHWNPSTETVQESELGNQMDSGPKDRVTNSEKASSDVGANHADCTETQDLYYGISPGMLEAQSPGIDPSTELDLNGKSESDDDATVVLSDHGTPEVHEDESHYITTHEIQLLELDHEVDYDVETGSSWDVEDDHQVYSFVDYAFFDCDETTATKRTSRHGHADTSAAAVSNLHDNGKEPSATKNPNTAGQIHLSIKATSRAVKHPSDIRGKHPRDKSRRGEKASDNATCFIAVPGRVHFGKPKGKDLNDYSSGASSAVSELDDADKEVRNLTARAFRSLACPYFDAIHFSANSESSASDHGRGINGWSTFVDLKYENPNTSSGRDQPFHNGPASKVHFAQKRDGITGLTLTGMRAPPVEIFALNGNLLSRQNASSTTKKFELMGKFSQGQNGVIRLCETLNFRCNVKSGPGNARLNKCAGGSSSTDEVSNTLPSARGSDPIPQPCNPGETMDDTHKKAIFASSLLKNVISKKMQFEQERKMERGEIRETHAHEHEAQREKGARGNPDGLQRQSSRFSEADSDRTIVSVDELGDIVDGNASDAKEERLSLESTDEAARGSKNGTSEAARGTLPRSQNSAFRSWRNGELGFQSEHKNDHGGGPATPDGCPRGTDVHVDTATCKHTKMSRLFVPSIRRPSGEGESGTPNVVHSGETEVRANALYVSDAARKSATSKSPEMKRSVRSIRGNKGDPFNIAKLLTPDIGCQKKTADDSRCHALAAAFKGESGDKVPHFIVRDVRDNKGKLQTPIHQVRDVRKLVKSSYHFVSLDAQDRCALLTSEGEHKTVKQSSCLKSASVSPIVIKCQSVNTNSNIKQSGNLIDPSKRRLPEDGFENDASSPRLPIEGPKNPSTPVPKPGSRLSSDNPKQEVPSGSRMEASAQKQDSVGEKKTDTKMANQAALEKLQAAVKTMEQLYVFDKKEWKRKKEPHRVEDSHLLSLIASEEHGATSEESQSTTVSAPTANADKLVRQDSNIENTSSLGSLLTQSEMAGKRGHNDTPETSTTPIPREEENGSEALVQPTGTLGRSTTLNHFQKPFATASSLKAVQTNVSSPTATCSKVVAPKSQKLPVCLKISKAKHATEKREQPNVSEREFAPLQFTSTADAENYLTIPVKPQATSAVKPSTSGLGKTAIYTTPATGDKTASPPYYLSRSKVRGHREIHQSQKRSSIVMETRSPDTPTATIYHTSLPVTMQASQPQVICFSSTVQPSPVPTEHFQHTQRKMLLDPTTGNYYLVDTPVHPATRRLFDPETGQYVDIPMPQPSPMTPVPMPISPLALSPGAYGPTYMFYPGYMPTTMIPAHTVQSQLSMQSEADEGNKSCSHIGQQEDGAYMESPYYMPTGKSSQTTSVAQHITTSRLASSKQPIISITSQQGPRIIAPPSFDGTTMSFVVEHR